MPDEQASTRVVRMTPGGQITLPADFRQRLGVTEDTMLRLTIDNGELRIAPERTVPESRGSPWLRDRYAVFAPVREEILERQIPEAEVNADIDAAINAVRTNTKPACTKPG